MRTTICFLAFLGAAMCASAQPATAPKSHCFADSVTQSGANIAVGRPLEVGLAGEERGHTFLAALSQEMVSSSRTGRHT